MKYGREPFKRNRVKYYYENIKLVYCKPTCRSGESRRKKKTLLNVRAGGSQEWFSKKTLVFCRGFRAEPRGFRCLCLYRRAAAVAEHFSSSLLLLSFSSRQSREIRCPMNILYNTTRPKAGTTREPTRYNNDERGVFLCIFLVFLFFYTREFHDSASKRR